MDSYVESSGSTPNSDETEIDVENDSNGSSVEPNNGDSNPCPSQSNPRVPNTGANGVTQGMDQQLQYELSPEQEQDSSLGGYICMMTQSQHLIPISPISAHPDDSCTGQLVINNNDVSQFYEPSQVVQQQGESFSHAFSTSGAQPSFASISTTDLCYLTYGDQLLDKIQAASRSVAISHGRGAIGLGARGSFGIHRRGGSRFPNAVQGPYIGVSNEPSVRFPTAYCNAGFGVRKQMRNKGERAGGVCEGSYGNQLYSNMSQLQNSQSRSNVMSQIQNPQLHNSRIQTNNASNSMNESDAMSELVDAGRRVAAAMSNGAFSTSKRFPKRREPRCAGPAIRRKIDVTDQVTTDVAMDDEQMTQHMDAYIEKFCPNTDPRNAKAMIFDLSKQPRNLFEAIPQYIDFLIANNEQVTRISDFCNVQRVPLDFLYSEPYCRDVMTNPISFPTKNFRAWLKAYNIDIEITDPDGVIVQETTFPPSFDMPSSMIQASGSLSGINSNTSFSKPLGNLENDPKVTPTENETSTYSTRTTVAHGGKKQCNSQVEHSAVCVPSYTCISRGSEKVAGMGIGRIPQSVMLPQASYIKPQYSTDIETMQHPSGMISDAGNELGRGYYASQNVSRAGPGVLRSINRVTYQPSYSSHPNSAYGYPSCDRNTSTPYEYNQYLPKTYQQPVFPTYQSQNYVSPANSMNDTFSMADRNVNREYPSFSQFVPAPVTVMRLNNVDAMSLMPQYCSYSNSTNPLAEYLCSQSRESLSNVIHSAISDLPEIKTDPSGTSIDGECEPSMLPSFDSFKDGNHQCEYLGLTETGTLPVPGDRNTMYLALKEAGIIGQKQQESMRYFDALADNSARFEGINGYSYLNDPNVKPRSPDENSGPPQDGNKWPSFIHRTAGQQYEMGNFSVASSNEDVRRQNGTTNGCFDPRGSIISRMDGYSGMDHFQDNKLGILLQRNREIPGVMSNFDDVNRDYFSCGGFQQGAESMPLQTEWGMYAANRQCSTAGLMQEFMPANLSSSFSWQETNGRTGENRGETMFQDMTLLGCSAPCNKISVCGTEMMLDCVGPHGKLSLGETQLLDVKRDGAEDQTSHSGFNVEALLAREESMQRIFVEESKRFQENAPINSSSKENVMLTPSIASDECEQLMLLRCKSEVCEYEPIGRGMRNDGGGVDNAVGARRGIGNGGEKLYDDYSMEINRGSVAALFEEVRGLIEEPANVENNVRPEVKRHGISEGGCLRDGDNKDVNNNDCSDDRFEDEVGTIRLQLE